MTATVYMLRCADGRYCVGSTLGSLELRVAQHNEGAVEGFTKRRRHVVLVWHQAFQRITDAITAGRQIKGWSRAKKEPIVRKDWEALQARSRHRADNPRHSTGSG
ncbi:MAG: GIY-YIG nuclease family protein [Alphaproteobacteria bacterium]|nr:GIY-YIG nuclease family protein [Alphaproteobacteria bacterium]